MATAQINACINSETKANGDRAFADIGCTPTHIIRLVWEFAECHKGDKETLRDFVGRLDEKSTAAKDDEIARKVRLAQKGPTIVDETLSRLGVRNAEAYDEPPYDDLLARAYAEKMAERGIAQ